MQATPMDMPGLSTTTYSFTGTLAADPILSRKRRMNFFDMANLLDRDGNLQNEMLVFAFAATMLSTIPVLLGNEFDVNVGLRRKRGSPDDVDDMSYSYYQAADETFPFIFSNYTYQTIMTAAKNPDKVAPHHHKDSAEPPVGLPKQNQSKDNYGTDENMLDLIRDLLIWSQEKVKDKNLLPMLINLFLDKYNGNSNPADKLVKTAYKKWTQYF